MANKSKMAFGALERVDEAVSNGLIDAYDVLLVKDADGKPYIGWIDKDGQKVICDTSADLADVEAELETKVDAEEVDTKIVEAKADTLTTANAYTDAQIEAKMAEIANAYEVIEF